MSGDVEPAKKILLPYLQRADELQKHEPLVAYYCRLYAMERGLKIPAKERTKTTNAVLVSLINQLEKDKKSLQLSPEDNLYVEGFALNVFTKADKQDRAGRADLDTAKTFYAASIFIEILHQFGQLQPDMEQKQKYAVWKAANIRKAISEGRKPVPGPPGGNEELSISSGRASDSELSPEKAYTKEIEGRPVEQASNAGFLPSQSMDVQEELTSQSSQHTPNMHDSTNSEYAPVFQQFSEPAPTGYTTSYTGSYLPSSATPEFSAVTTSITHDQYGSRAQLDGSHGPSYNGNNSQYVSVLPDLQGGFSMPTYFTHHGGSDAVYYQSHISNAAVYPVPTYPQEHNSFPPAEIKDARFKDSSGLERTTSAPTIVKEQVYQPPPEKIAEAQKASKFAVSALAFDDVPTAISYLKQSLELLTIPSASVQHS